MKPFTILLCIAVAILHLTVSSIAEENKNKVNNVLTPEILNKISRPEDTPFETEAKRLIAEYVLAVATQNDIDVAKSKDPLTTAVLVEDIPSDGNERGRLDTIVSSPAEESENNLLTPAVLNKLTRPEDTEFEAEAKKLIAEYLLAVATLSDIDAKKSKEALSTAVVEDNLSDIDAKGRQDAVTAAPAAPAVAATAAPAATQAPNAAAAVTQAPAVTGLGTTSRPRPSDAHILGQVDKILQNVYQGNVSGIIDQSLGIRNNTPVRNLVNGIIGLVLCAPWDRLLGRCGGQQSSALG